jgi:hypothetical protein
MTLDEIIIWNQATSMRQSAEWGMGSFQALLPKLRNRIDYKYFGVRRIMMKMMILLYNLCTRWVGINQIRNVYMPSLGQNVDLLYYNVIDY